ncbi:hypothetical protein U1Q18_000974 [Sarracenia purpurea var. burkii]
MMLVQFASANMLVFGQSIGSIWPGLAQLLLVWLGDLRAFLKRKGSLKPMTTVKYALDIASNESEKPI